MAMSCTSRDQQLRGLLLGLVDAAELEGSPGEFDILAMEAWSSHRGAQVAAPDVALHHDAAADVLPLTWLGPSRSVMSATSRTSTTAPVGEISRTSPRRPVVAVLVVEGQDHLEGAVAVEHLADHLALVVAPIASVRAAGVNSQPAAAAARLTAMCAMRDEHLLLDL